MKALIKKGLLISLLLPLVACAHYYPRQYGYYPNAGGYDSGNRVWQRNYYGGPPSYYPNHRNWSNENHFNRRHHSDVPDWDRDDRRPQGRQDRWNNRQGYHYQEDVHDHNNRNSWQHRIDSAADHPRYQQRDGLRNHTNVENHQRGGNNMPSQNERRHWDHDDDR